MRSTPDAPQERHREAKQPADSTREEDDACQDREQDEEHLDPQIGADRVAADRERKPDRREHERHRAAEGAFEQHCPGDRGAEAGMALRRLVDPRRIATDRSREDLSNRVRDDVRTGQPGKGLVDTSHAQQHLPAPGLWRHRDDGEERRQPEPGRIGVGDDVACPAEVDLREDVGDREAGDHEGGAEPHRLALQHRAKRSCTRRRASIASRMSSSEWAGESGSESTSAPARSLTGSGP